VIWATGPGRLAPVAAVEAGRLGDSLPVAFANSQVRREADFEIGLEDV
jgi:hypothetical protein